MKPSGTTQHFENDLIKNCHHCARNEIEHLDESIACLGRDVCVLIENMISFGTCVCDTWIAL